MKSLKRGSQGAQGEASLLRGRSSSAVNLAAMGRPLASPLSPTVGPLSAGVLPSPALHPLAQSHVLPTSFDDHVRQNFRDARDPRSWRNAVKNTWIAVSFWICGARPRDRFVISILMLLFVAFLVSFIALSLSNASYHVATAIDETAFDYSFVTLDSGFPTSPILSSTVGDAANSKWNANRRYGVVIDAGSSGSRVYIYSWKLAAPANDRRLPSIEKGVPADTNLPWSKSISPGISSISDFPVSSIEKMTYEYLKPLLDFATSNIPNHQVPSTPIYLLATAGMRLLKKGIRDEILRQACHVVQKHYRFDISGGCRRQFRVISGESEGIFGWVAVNYLNDGFGDPANQVPIPPFEDSPNTFGFLDMGGASTQIAFEPISKMKLLHSDDLLWISLRTVTGIDMSYQLFVSTFLGFGVNEARKRHVQNLAKESGYGKFDRRKEFIAATSVVPEDPDAVGLDDDELVDDYVHPTTNGSEQMGAIGKWITDPCLPKDLILDDPALLKIPSPRPQLLGTGSLQQCIGSLRPQLQKSVPCPELPCLFNGVHAPILNFTKHRFIGVSEYYYTPSAAQSFSKSSSDVADTAYHYSDFLKSAEKVCKTKWNDLKVAYSKTQGVVPVVGSIEEARLQLQCFKSSWVLEVLHEGFGIPKEELTDALNSDGQKLKELTPFTPANELSGFSISWTLGAMLFHVCSTIPTKDRNSSAASTPSVESFAWIRSTVAILFLVVAVLLAVVFWRRYKRAQANLYRRRGSRMELPPLTSIWTNPVDEEALLAGATLDRLEAENV